MGDHTLPNALHLPIREVERDWMIPDEARISRGDVRSAQQASTRDALRATVMHDMRSALLDLRSHEVRRAMDALHIQLGVTMLSRDSHRACTALELLKLAGEREGDSLVSIGAHTVSHPRLALLDAQEQTEELHESRLVLESILGRSVTSAAYPFGRSIDVNRDTASAARAAGLDVACTLSPAALCGGRTDPMLLPRFAVHPMDGDELSRWLRYVALG